VTPSRMLADMLRRGYSQADLARMLDVHHSQVSRWVKHGPPRTWDAFALLQKFHSKANP
jgi:transposase